MKKRRYKISIPTPCNENWEAMTPSEKGRFCSACQKTVVDFTYKQDAEIYDILKGGNVCGRFSSRQIEMPVVVSEPEPSLTWWQAAALAGFGLFSFKTAAGANTVKKPAEIISHIAGRVANGPDLSKTWKVVHVVVRGGDEHAFVNASLYATGMLNGKPLIIDAIADKDGQYTIKLPQVSGLQLVCLAEGYDTQINELVDFKDQVITLRRSYTFNDDTLTGRARVASRWQNGIINEKDSAADKRAFKNIVNDSLPVKIFDTITPIKNDTGYHSIFTDTGYYDVKMYIDSTKNWKYISITTTTMGFCTITPVSPLEDIIIKSNSGLTPEKKVQGMSIDSSLPAFFTNPELRVAVANDPKDSDNPQKEENTAMDRIVQRLKRTIVPGSKENPGK